MHTIVDYSGRNDADRAALIDTVRYIGGRRFRKVIRAAKTHADPSRYVNMLLSFMGVSGYPYHAFCRRYCLQAYREWMAEDSDGPAIQTDPNGFPL